MNFLNQLRIGKRLTIGFLMVNALFVVMVAITALQVERVRTVSMDMEEQAEMLSLAEKVLADVQQNAARSQAIARSADADMTSYIGSAMAAAMKNGTLGPPSAPSAPIAGPITKPTPKAAPMRPMRRGRLRGELERSGSLGVQTLLKLRMLEKAGRFVPATRAGGLAPTRRGAPDCRGSTPTRWWCR